MIRSEDVAAAVEAIRDWPPADQEWWRKLLDVAPEEAILVADLAVTLGAVPVDPVLYS